MLTNTIEIGTARRLLRRMTRAARTAVSPRAPIPVAFALAVLAVLATAAPEQAAAQTETTFISNTGQSGQSSSDANRAQGFTTGTGTYTLSSVALYLHPQTSGTPQVQIYGSTGGNPGTLVATMTNPATIVGSAINVFTAPANTTLSASTEYWLVTSNSATTTGLGFEVAVANTSNLDTGTAAGWSLGDTLFRNDKANSWNSSSLRPRFQIRGTAQTTTPTNNAPAFADTTLTRSIAENTAANVNVGAVIPAATDTDTGDTLTYTMEGTDAAEFNFNATTRQITTKAGVTYDFEAKSSYSVTIKVTDETDTDTVDVTITLTDVNEPPSAPGAPTVAATSGSTTSLDVSWTAPANSGKPAITSYDLQYRAGTSGSFTDGPQNVTGTSTAIASLNSGTSYQVQVRATNDEGDSGWSGSGNGSTSTVTPTNNAPVFADTTLTRSIAENTAADANVGAVIPVATDTDSGDTLTYTMEGTDAAEFNFNATTRQITTKAGVTYDFETKSSYSVTIKVTDETDTDTVDVTITLTDVNEPPSAPGAPTVAATSGSTTSLDVSWTAPANSGKPAIASYDLQYRAGTSGSFTDGPQNVTGTSTAIASLNSGTSYQVQVRATNDEGDSGWSGSGNGSTSTPTNNPPVLANVIPDQTATAGTAFSYQVPANTFNDTDTGDTLSYTAMKADDTTLPTWLTFTAATRTFTGTPASTDTGTVSVKVTATDTSSASVSDEFDIMVIPTAPAGLRAETGDGRVRLSWTEPTPQVDHAYRYAAGASVPPATAWTAVGNIEKATALISGLTNGTAHAFEVRVVGSGGVGPGAAATISATPSVAACSAPSLGGRRSVWSATLTVGRTDFGISYSAGYNHRQGSTPYGSLSPSVDFSIGGTSYTINVLDTFIRSGDRRIMSLGLADARTFPDAVRTALRLHWCSDSSGFIFTNPLYTVVDDNDADWSIHTTREVALSLPANNAATGAPTVTGTAQAGETLTAGMGNIADADGLPATFPGDYEFQWVRVDADGTSNASDITNATANTYTLTADDVGKRVRVRVSFFDVLGGDEAILGAPSVVVVSAVPGAPTGLTATASGTDTISLSWTAPADNGGSAITGYKIEVSTDNETTWSDLVADTTSTATTYEHTGLAASTTRHYRVSAINSIGTGTASDVVNTTTDAATATVPGAPTGLTATASGSSTINLSWTAPTSTGGSAITGYKIEVSTDSETTWTDLVANTASTATSYEHAGLAGGTTRHYRVSAINGIGTSATASNVANATTGPTDDCAGDTTTTCSVSPAATPGGSVTGNIEVAGDLDWFSFSVISGVEYQIDVEGAATSKGSLVDPIFELYDSNGFIDSNDDGGTGLNSRLVWTADRTGTVYVEVARSEGLGSTYTLTVTVRTAAATAPGAPTGLTATASGPSTITLSWTAPTSTGGSAITGYQIEASSNGGTTFNVLVATTNNATTTYAHTGLAASTTRHYRVSAINSTGTGTPSNVASATTGAATNAPGAPTGLTATASGPSTINLSWTAPTSTGGSAISGYKIESLARRHHRLDRPGRQHRHHHLRPHHQPDGLPHALLPRVRHQRQRHRPRLHRRLCHHGGGRRELPAAGLRHGLRLLPSQGDGKHK